MQWLTLECGCHKISQNKSVIKKATKPVFSSFFYVFLEIQKEF
jgi:hypothetical protein